MVGKDDDTPHPQAPALDDDLARLLARLGSACIDSPGCCDQPVARALFWRVELGGEPLERAAAALGLDPLAAQRLLRDAQGRALLTLLCALAAPTDDRSGP